MDQVLNVAISYLVPLALGGALGVLWKKMTNNQRQDDMLLALGRYRLIYECEAILAQGSITPTQFEMLTKLYEAYAGLDGNGVGEALYKRAIALPIREEIDVEC